MIAAGETFAQRFEILAQTGSGGMGTIFRTLDLHTGAIVALKLMSEQSTLPSDLERFGREARMLAELRHPGIVAYVAHGQSPEGFLYLAMEWLEGEDLAQRLLRGPLSINDTLILLRGVSAALGLAHHRGIIHRGQEGRARRRKIRGEPAPPSLRGMRQDRCEALKNRRSLKRCLALPVSRATRLESECDRLRRAVDWDRTGVRPERASDRP